MRIVVLEDERPALEDLLAAVRACRPDVEVLANHDSLAGATAWFRDHPAPDVVFADVQLTDGRSIDLIAALALPCPVVFVTAYDRYTLAALEAGGIDYLLKPVETARVARTLEKVDRLKQHFEAQRGPRQRLVVRRGGESHAIDTDAIAWFGTEHRLVFLVTSAGQRFVVDKTLNALTEQLDPGQFFRIGRSWLVSSAAVRGYRPIGKGRLALQLEPPSAQPAVVSAEVAAAFKGWLDR